MIAKSYQNMLSNRSILFYQFLKIVYRKNLLLLQILFKNASFIVYIIKPYNVVFHLKAKNVLINLKT